MKGLNHANSTLEEERLQKDMLQNMSKIVGSVNSSTKKKGILTYQPKTADMVKLHSPRNKTKLL